METQEKLFCYTELNCFAAPGTVREDGEDLVQPSVGNVYFRTLGVYGRETTDQDDEDIPPREPLHQRGVRCEVAELRVR